VRGVGLRTTGAAALFVCAATVPFLARPLHVDDEVYVRGAEQILADPTNPLGGTQLMLGAEMPTYRFTHHPPLVSAVIAAVIGATGEVEPWQLHAAFLAFPLVAALAMLGLSRRFVGHPLAATLLLAATPAFVVGSHGLMTDVPLLALWLAACVTGVAGIDAGCRRRLAAAAVALALACAVQYRALLLAPVLLGYAWLQRRPLAPAALAAVPAVVVLAAWSWWNHATLGVLHVLDASGTIPMTPERLLRDGIAYASFTGGATVFPGFLLFAVRRRLRLPIAGGILAATGLVLWRWAPEHAGLQAWLLGGFCAVGLATLLGVVPEPSAWRREPAPAGAASPEADRDDLFLFGAVALVLASHVLLNLFASVRSLLLALPFLVLLIVREVERSTASASGARRALGTGVVATAALALAVAVADYRLAEAHRDLGEGVGCEGEGCRVWFSGEWGFRYAMERRGFRYLLTAENSPREGDVVIMPDVPCPSNLHPGLVDRLQLLRVVDSQQRFPIKVASFRDHAAFYSDFFGLLPYSFSSDPLDRIRVFRVAR